MRKQKQKQKQRRMTEREQGRVEKSVKMWFDVCMRKGETHAKQIKLKNVSPSIWNGWKCVTEFSVDILAGLLSTFFFRLSFAMLFCIKRAFFVTASTNPFIYSFTADFCSITTFLVFFFLSFLFSVSIEFIRFSDRSIFRKAVFCQRDWHRLMVVNIQTVATYSAASKMDS